MQVIAINQDPLGKSAVRIDGSRTWNSLMHRTPLTPPESMWGNGEQLAKPLANGDVAVLLFNRLNTTMDIVSSLISHAFSRDAACALQGKPWVMGSG